MKIKVKGKEINIPVPFIVTILIALIICILILFFIHRIGEPWSTLLSNNIGSIIGALTTIIAFYLTYSLNKKQNDALRRLEEEQIRIQSLPFLNAENVALDDDLIADAKSFDSVDYLIFSIANGVPSDTDDNECITENIELTNIGVAPAINVNFLAGTLGNIPVNSSKIVQLQYQTNTTNFEIPIVYFDRQYRKYTQILKFKLRSSNSFYLAETTAPVLTE